MKKFLVFLIIVIVGGYFGIAFLMENLTFEGLPGQVGRGTACAIWDGVVTGDMVNIPTAEVEKAVDFNPKIRLLKYRGTVQRISPVEAEKKPEPGAPVYKVAWPQPLQKGQKLAYFRAQAAFTVESRCVPFRIAQKDYKITVITWCPR